MNANEFRVLENTGKSVHKIIDALIAKHGSSGIVRLVALVLKIAEANNDDAAGAIKSSGIPAHIVQALLMIGVGTLAEKITSVQRAELRGEKQKENTCST